MNLEDLVKKFVALASQPKLSKAEQEEARDLMKQLKEAGMSNEQISKLSKGRWSPSTVKFYTPGIKPAHPGSWDDAVDLLKGVIDVGFTLNDVETALKVSERLKSQGVNLDDMIGLQFAVDSSSLDLAEVVHQYQSLKESGLLPDQISEALSFKKELAKMGLKVGSVVPIIELAKNYGDPDKVIEALSQYKSLIDLDQYIAAANSKLNGIQEQLTNKQEQIESAKANLSKLDNLIAAYEKIKKLGFGVTELSKLSTLAQKHGTVTKLMDVVDAYNTYSDILDKLNKAKSDLVTSKSDSEKLQAGTAHIKTAVTMCRTLIDEYSFGLDAVATLFSMAGKYGTALDVLKGVEAYGKLETLNQEVASKKGEASQLKEEIAHLAGQRKQSQESLESLSALAVEVGNQVGKVEGQAAGHNQLQKLLVLIGNPEAAGYEEYIETGVVLALALKRWVTKNETRFKHYDQIKSGLESLFKAVGGLE